MAGWNYTSVNVTKEQHEQLKRIAGFKKVGITQGGCGKWTLSISRDSWPNTAK